MKLMSSSQASIRVLVAAIAPLSWVNSPLVETARRSTRRFSPRGMVVPTKGDGQCAAVMPAWLSGKKA